MNSVYQDKITFLQKELDYTPILESVCKRVVEYFKPHPSQCNLEYYYDTNHRLDKIHVKIDDVVHGVIVCGRILDNDDITSISYIKPYELILGEILC